MRTAQSITAAGALWARRWEQALDDEFVRLVRCGRIDQAAARLRSQLTSETPEPRRAPQVAIVGAGPGDGGLLTLRARQLLGEADVVVFDGLVATELVDGKPSVYVGEGPAWNWGRRGPTQAGIQKLAVLLARQRKRGGRL